MNPVFSERENEWRQEVRDFLDAELPEEFARDPEFTEDEDYWDFAKEFTRAVGKRGWIGLSWPEQYGGLGRPALDRLILAEEFAYRDAPLVNQIGWGLAAGALLFSGSEEQRHRFLPGIATMDRMWVEGFTEPNAGSDLASLTTRADRDGDEWIINGQKTYTTWGSHGDVMFLAARTDQQASRHRGISIFCVDLQSPGVSMSPLFNLGGGRQNHTFFDDVRVSHDMLIGAENEGWAAIMNAFYGAAGISAPYAGYQRRLDALVDYCNRTDRDGQRLADDPLVRDKVAELALILHAEKLLTYDGIGRGHTDAPPFGGALDVVVAKESMPRFAELYNEVVGSLMQLSTGSEWAPLDGMTEAWYRWSFRAHAGGTSQVKRMVLATRGLGLPR
jgi:alkylation response protein AidB-like acyl-CoA dehydrogenase